MNDPTLLSCVPVLQVRDARRSCRFYCDQLGFTQDWEHQFEPDLPLFVCISRGPITLFLTEHPESAFGALIYLYVDRIDTLASEFQTNGVVLDLHPTDQPWGVREMHLSDPDGNKLRFGQPLTEPQNAG